MCRWREEGGRLEIETLRVHPPSKASTLYPLFFALLASTLLCLTLWSFNHYIMGNRLDCRGGSTSFCALRLHNGAGVSVQGGQGQRVTVWEWGPNGCCNRRVWPEE